MTQSTDVAVVGGGLAGLAAAAYLGRAGLSVTVVERAATLGGRGATRREAGFALNRGPHALFQKGEAAAVLAELGVATPGRKTPRGGKALCRGALHQLPASALSMLTTGLLGFAAKADAARLLERLPRMRPSDLAGRSVSEWLDSIGLHPDARMLVESVVRVSTYVNAPGTFSAETALRQIQRALPGVLYIDGGWQTLVDGLAARATASGATIVTGARVESVVRDGAAGYALTLADGHVIAARGVVLAVGPREVTDLLGSSSGDVCRMGGTRSVRVATLDLALSRLPERHEPFVLGIDRPLYLSIHSSTAKLAPEGAALVHAMKYLGDDETDPDTDRAELEALVDLAVPGWRPATVHAQYLPRMVAAERLDTRDGAAGRPGPEVPEFPSIMLAGDWVKGGSWLADASLGSAREAAKVLVARLEPSRAVA